MSTPPYSSTTTIGSASVVYSTQDTDYGYIDSFKIAEKSTQKKLTNSAGEMVKLILSGKELELTGSFVRVGSTGLSVVPAVDVASIGSIVTFSPESGVTIAAVITDRSTSYKKGDFVSVDFTAITSQALSSSLTTGS